MFSRKTAAANRQESESRKIYEVMEFASLGVEQQLLQVRHTRTTYLPNGQIWKESLSLETCLDRIVRAFHGYTYQSAGVIIGFFDAPEQANQCASAIAEHIDKQVNVCGTQVTILI